MRLVEEGNEPEENGHRRRIFWGAASVASESLSSAYSMADVMRPLVIYSRADVTRPLGIYSSLMPKVASLQRSSRVVDSSRLS